MESKNLLTLAITLTVGIILAGSLLMPVISDATETERTYVNDGYARYSSIDSDSTETVIITWDHTDPTYLTINSTDKVDVGAYTSWASVVFGDDWTIRYINQTLKQVQYIGPTSSDFVGVNTNGTKDLTITLTAGSLTVTDGTTTKTASYTTAYYPALDGNMIMKYSTGTAYLLEDSSIIIANGIAVGLDIGIHFEGTIAEGYEFNIYHTSTDYEVANVATVYTEIAGYNGLVELTKITFDVTPDGGSASEATYSYFLVPYQVTAERSQHLNDGEIAILSALPVLIIAALVVTAAGALYLKRDD